jgi:hypothetical protein
VGFLRRLLAYGVPFCVNVTLRCLVSRRLYLSGLILAKHILHSDPAYWQWKRLL